MDGYHIYQDIAKRTDGDIYIGVVGPVRTGKSTFIKKFMETLVLPGITADAKRDRAIDELPQSSSGKTIMTTEPKFIPNEAVEITIGDNTKLKVRLIDCVGYIVPSALGYIEENAPRMVQTPWFGEPIPFNNAAEIGTKKVITEHSTIGLVVSTDGSFGEIPRPDYEDAEQRVVEELLAIDKPFVIVLNTATPEAEQTQTLANGMREKYGVPVVVANCSTLNEDDIRAILENMLFEFPVREILMRIPGWIDRLEDGHWLKQSVYQSIIDAASGIRKLSEISAAAASINRNEYLASACLSGIDLGRGLAVVDLRPVEGLFYRVLGEETGLDIEDDENLIAIMGELVDKKRKYDRIADALEEVNAKGYGIVTPSIDELRLEEPEIVKHGGRFGVKLKASAPSIHMIRADIQTEISPVVGSEKQSEELAKYLLDEFDENPKMIWESNIFGKSLHELVNEDLHSKLSHMPDDARQKLQDTLQRIINDGSGGLICIIL